MKKRTNWVFACPKHGIEEGLFCHLAYSKEYADCWMHVEYIFKEIKSNKEEKDEWVRIMNLTRQYNGQLPS